MIAGFCAVAVITLIVGAVGYYGMVRGGQAIEEIGLVRLPSVDSLTAIQMEVENVRGTMRTLGIPGLSSEMRQRQYDNLDAARARYREAWARYESLPQTIEEAELWGRFVLLLDAWREENQHAVEMARDIDAMVSTYYRSELSETMGYVDAVSMARTKALQAAIDLGVQIQEWKNILIRGNDTSLYQKHLGAFDSSERAVQSLIGDALVIVRSLGLSTDEAERLMTAHRELGVTYRNGLRQFQTADPESGKKVDVLVRGADRAVMAGLRAFVKSLDDALETAQGRYDAFQDHLLGPVTQRQQDAMEAMSHVVKINREIAAEAVRSSQRQAAFIEMVVFAFAIMGTLLALTLGVLLTRSITRPIHRIIGGLGTGAEEVASASEQLSMASQSLAEGAGEQAASLEQTSASLEQMSSMTQQNAANARQANGLMAETKTVVSKADDSMTRLTSSMSEISSASDETSKIIKTIDEIAFQTNLLALNAAVEAARAGEAGAGFAVVADEVRNLAMRAAEAAKNTSQLIEGTIKKVHDGSELVATANDAFRQVAQSSLKVAGLIEEISSASAEQSQGIEEVNKAVSQMDRVTQQNAANAEESAAASEELSAQTGQMRSMVAELVALVGGGKVEAEVTRRTLTPAGPTIQVKSGKKEPRGRKDKACDLIPFDDDDFKDF